MDLVHRKALVAVGVLVATTTVLVPASPSAADTAPLPTSVVHPPEGNGVPFDITAPVDITTFGYIEEEFLVSGFANVYRYGESGAVDVQVAEVPYATRILLRRPGNPRQFSGNVFLETSHPEHGIDYVWAQTWDYLLSGGHVYVSVATRRTTGAGFSAIELMKSFDPARYEPLLFPEDGLTWDIIGQVGRLLKTRVPENPLAAYDVKRVYAMGWSGGGALQLLYISDGFHGRARMPDGGPIFDGYLVGEPSGYPRINRTTSAIPTTDPRQKVQPRDVPAISLHTRPQEQFRRRADSDAPNDRYRVYEVAGAAHADLRIGQSQQCTFEITRFPMHHLFKSTLERLDAWSARAITPPASQRIALDENNAIVRDEHGNPLGGVRHTYTDVPTARYFTNAGPLGCSSFGAQERFSHEKLVELYVNHGGYVSRVNRRVMELERDGWLLRADAQQIRQEAASFDGI